MDNIEKAKELILSYGIANIVDNIKEFNYDKYDNEFTRICLAQRLRDSQGVINFWHKKFQEQVFTIEHPTLNIKLQAIANFQYEYINFLFLANETKEHICLCVQITAVFDMVILINVNSNIDKHAKIQAYLMTDDWASDNVKNIQSVKLLNKFLELPNESFSKYNKEYCILLHAKRPVHFFNDIFSAYIQLEYKRKQISSKPSFFYPTSSKELICKDKDCVEIQLGKICYSTDYFDYLYVHSIEKTRIQLSDDYDLKIWINIPGERRVWVDQINNIANIIQEISKYYNNIFICFDGMTSYDGEVADFGEGGTYMKIVFKIIENLNFNVNIKSINNNFFYYSRTSKVNISWQSLSGFDYRTKIQYCDQMDVCLVELSTAFIVPFACKKTSIFYYSGNDSQNYYKTLIINRIKNVKIVDKKYVNIINPQDLEIFHSYEISYKYIFNLLAEILNNIHNKQISYFNID